MLAFALFQLTWPRNVAHHPNVDRGRQHSRLTNFPTPSSLSPAQRQPIEGPKRAATTGDACSPRANKVRTRPDPGRPGQRTWSTGSSPSRLRTGSWTLISLPPHVGRVLLHGLRDLRRVGRTSGSWTRWVDYAAAGSVAGRGFRRCSGIGAAPGVAAAGFVAGEPPEYFAAAGSLVGRGVVVLVSSTSSMRIWSAIDQLARWRE